MGNDNIFCNEPIIGVYLGEPKHNSNGDLFLDCYQEEITLYLTKDFRYILETEHYGISVEYDGIYLLNKTENIVSLAKEGEWLESYFHGDFSDETPWIDHEYTLFIGERLLCAEKVDEGYILTFADLSIKVVPIEEDNTDNSSEKLWDHENHRMYGFERYLKQKCAYCGGKGTAYFDFVGDYFVKCEKCSKGICSQMNMQDAIDEWNYINTHND